MTDQPASTGDAAASLIGAVIGVTAVLLFTAVLVTIGFNEGIIPAAKALGANATGSINVLQGLFVSVFAYAVFGRHTLSIAKGN
ncbi:MAG: hypothetical protein ACEQSX_13410 [Baekduiaceae bacterium]